MDDQDSLFKRLAKGGVRALPHSIRAKVEAARRRQTVRTISLESLDAELEEAAALFARSEDDARAFLNGIAMEVPADIPNDPFSDEYREWTWNLYRRISGRESYLVANEGSPFDFDAAVSRPYPYATGSAEVVGNDLITRGFIIKTLGQIPPARIVEFGPGWGNLTNDLVAMGFDLTGVEVEPQFCALAEARSRISGHPKMVKADMLTFSANDLFDAAIFFESFHHCSDHLQMLHRLHEIITADGIAVFAAEPISPLGYPWGPRLDGLSLWSSRTYGWLELGFDPVYFDEALHRTGWSAVRHRYGRSVPGADVLIARAIGAAEGHKRLAD